MILNSRGKLLSHEALLCRTAEIIFIYSERRGEVQPPVLFLLKVPTPLSCFCSDFSDNVAAETRQRQGKLQLFDCHPAGNTSVEVECWEFSS